LYIFQSRILLDFTVNLFVILICNLNENVFGALLLSVYFGSLSANYCPSKKCYMEKIIARRS